MKRLLLGICAALVLYVFSIGPAARIYSGKSAPRAVIYLYAPVAWLHDHTPLRRPLETYIHFWDPEKFDTSRS